MLQMMAALLQMMAALLQMMAAFLQMMAYLRTQLRTWWGGGGYGLGCT